MILRGLLVKNFKTEFFSYFFKLCFSILKIHYVFIINDSKLHPLSIVCCYEPRYFRPEFIMENLYVIFGTK